MHYNGPIIRPQTDADSVFIEVTVGCTHDSCTFCNFYHGYPFRVAPIAQVEEDLKEASRLYPHAKKVWASGGNPYALSTEKLAELARLFKKYLPEGRISTYARVDDLLRKSVEEMRFLKELGFEDIVVGIESGDDEVLAHVNKGYTAADILEGCKKLEEAGVDYRVIYLSGLAGHGKAYDSALKSARILNQLHPYLMILTTVAILPDTKLYEEWKAGAFAEVTERERLDEFRTLLSNLKNEIIVFSATSTNSMPFVVRLPEEREEIINRLDQAISAMSEEQEKRITASRHRMTSV
ncbi:MAG: radical SAM protein [Ruminococcus sp.]|jgi:radical SAM superfamily enzyme YgiQ (UPF0313 family)